MKKLGFIVNLLVSTTSFYGTAVLADSLKIAQPPVDLSANQIVMVQPKIDVVEKDIEVDQNTVLKDLNSALEQKVNQKLEALLATQIQNLEKQTLAQQ